MLLNNKKPLKLRPNPAKLFALTNVWIEMSKTVDLRL